MMWQNKGIVRGERKEGPLFGCADLAASTEEKDTSSYDGSDMNLLIDLVPRSI
jgi:hypothetical protein